MWEVLVVPATVASGTAEEHIFRVVDKAGGNLNDGIHTVVLQA